MKLFLVEFDNGMSWDDHFRFVIGVYSTQEKAQAIADEIDKVEADNYSCGGCIITVIGIDKRIVQ